MNKEVVLTVSCILAITVFVGVLILGSIISKRSTNNKTYIKPFWIFAIGVFISAVIVYYPTYYLNYFSGNDGNFEVVVKSLALSIHNAMRLFVLDGEFDALRDTVLFVNANTVISTIYSLFGAILYVVAPVMTAGIVLTFVKNANAYVKYYSSLKKDIYYFTELNEKSITLAENVHSLYGKKVVKVFLNVDLSDEYNDLLVRARNIEAICFNGKEITELSLRKTSKSAIRKVYFIAENQNKNVEQALFLINKYHHNKWLNNHNTQFYVFSLSPETAILLDNADNSDIKVRHVDECRNLIYDILRNNSIFNGAIETDGIKKINVLLLGLGKSGTELLKAICWCGQMLGYEITINVVDKNKNVEASIAGLAPEIIKYNGNKIEGEAQYTINFYEGIDVESITFRNLLSKLGNVTVSYSMLGNDDINLSSAIIVREEFGRLNMSNGINVPSVYAIVESPEKSETIISNGGLKDYTGSSYGINILGNIKDSYSLSIIEQEELEQKGLKCHLRWSQTGEDIVKDTKKFDNYEYFRRASIAEALYSELRIKMGILMGDNDGDEEYLKEYEHRRWNAYMRTEGYVYGKVKNTILKTHPSLTPYMKLSDKEKEKDKVVLEASEE